MGRAPCCDKASVKKGPWSPEEDEALRRYVETHGSGGNWIALPQKAGLKRCGKSCRLRWLNYLRPNIKHGGFSEEEDNMICSLYNQMGSKWSVIASHLPGRTDNDVKNHWNTKLKKKLLAGKMNLTNNKTITYQCPSLTTSLCNNSPEPKTYNHQLESYSTHNYSSVPQYPQTYLPSDIVGQYGQTSDHLILNKVGASEFCNPPISSAPISFSSSLEGQGSIGVSGLEDYGFDIFGYDVVAIDHEVSVSFTGFHGFEGLEYLAEMKPAEGMLPTQNVTAGSGLENIEEHQGR